MNDERVGVMYKGLKQETRFLYKGFPCVVLFMPGGYRCGYVGLPKENKYYGKSCEKFRQYAMEGSHTHRNILSGRMIKILTGSVLTAHTSVMGEMRNWRAKCILKTWK